MQKDKSGIGNTYCKVEMPTTGIQWGWVQVRNKMERVKGCSGQYPRGRGRVTEKAAFTEKGKFRLKQVTLHIHYMRLACQSYRGSVCSADLSRRARGTERVEDGQCEGLGSVRLTFRGGKRERRVRERRYNPHGKI